MARRKELKNIVSGLFSSFISRNNDVSGYWGVGKLCLLAQHLETSVVCLDLLAQSLTPASEEFAKLAAGYHSLLQHRVAAKGLAVNCVSSATIELDFNPERPAGRYLPIVTRGDLFKLTVTLIDDRGKEYRVSGYSYCAPHDPKRELRSAGAERF